MGTCPLPRSISSPSTASASGPCSSPGRVCSARPGTCRGDRRPAPGRRARRRPHRHGPVLRTRCRQRPDPRGAPPVSHGLVLVSKVGARRDSEGGWHPAQRPEELRAAVEDNLRSLEVECLGAVNLRLMTGHATCRRTSRWPTRTSWRRWRRCATRARSPASGCPPPRWPRCDQAIDAVGIVCVQNAFSLLDQSDAPVLERCQAAGCRLRALLPARLGLPRDAQGHRGPGRRRWWPSVVCHAGPGRPGLAARPRARTSC